MKLFMILLGCKPKGRRTEQHDIFFGIAETLKDLIPFIKDSWPEAEGEIHIDAWREINYVEGYGVSVAEKKNFSSPLDAAKLFFINLGGYKKDEFDEFHYKMIVACKNKGEATQRAKLTAFYKHTGFKGAASHIDDKYGIDVDDFFEIEEALSQKMKELYTIVLTPEAGAKEDAMNLGYCMLEKL